MEKCQPQYLLMWTIAAEKVQQKHMQTEPWNFMNPNPNWTKGMQGTQHTFFMQWTAGPNCTTNLDFTCCHDFNRSIEEHLQVSFFIPHKKLLQGFLELIWVKSLCHHQYPPSTLHSYLGLCKAYLHDSQQCKSKTLKIPQRQICSSHYTVLLLIWKKTSL